jgi:hypothetical protein
MRHGSAELTWAIVGLALIAALLLPRLIRNQLSAPEPQRNVFAHVAPAR